MIETIETSSLGDRSYLATDGQVAVVVDPQRDIDRVLDLVGQRGLQVSHVVETHVHNDYVTGGLELTQRTGAAYVLAEGSGVAFDHVAVKDGQVLEAGAMRLRVLLTPGHTHFHLSYVLETADQVRAVFTGGSMLYGATGRTDLLGPADTQELTHAQFHSVRRLASELPAETEVFPTHGFGSFCSATPTSGTASTVGEQQRVNPALTLEEQEYVDTLLAGLDAYPAYYAHMAPMNSAGPAPVDLSLPQPVDPAELHRRIEAGEWVVDLRQRTAFAAGHLSRSLNFELGTNFVTYLGWLYSYGAPLTLIGESEDQVADARRELVRIGIDDLAGIAVGDIDTLADGQPLRSYRVTDFPGLAEARQHGPLQILDARRNDERAAGYVAGSQHIPLHELADRLDEVPTGEVWVYCGSGYRASIAASVLDTPGRDVVLINDSYGSAAQAGLEDDRPTEGAGATRRFHRQLTRHPTNYLQGRTMTTAAPDKVDATTVRSWLDQPDRVTVLDVRSPAEFETARIPGSINVPLNLVEKHAGQLAERLDRQVVLVCQSGNRATQAQQRLAGAGAEHLHVLDGGVAAFRSAGGEVVEGRARWSLERQVRFVAGSLVLGSLIASLRTPKAGLLAGGVGTGLTLSALTDSCTMGRVLSALPYNRGPKDRSPEEVLDQLPEPQPTR